ncbi:DUF6270 domain-containing protein [Pseudomonas sp. NBRC 111140]|uniref:DUF6270 domain-containing protein n=1 Tax=Pseudomonas sp. NBRC 111140 TaxID=1661055 RepID=UPI000761CF71|nr:DUF6270 domain-containing protein [Pseudomonas sp. NBRC 111140]
MIKNLIIYGSCVSRDIFNLEESRNFKLTDYFARCSMASLSSAPYENEEALNRIPSDFRRRMVACDFSKKILTEAEKLSSADVILIDLIDERFDLVTLLTGQILTNSNELSESGLLADNCVSGYQLIKHGSAEHRELWIQGMNKFLSVLEQHNKLDTVVVNKVYWATRFEHASVSDFPASLAATEKANQELDWMYSELEKKLGKHQFLQFQPDFLTADEFHRWGASPFHYCERYYRKALELLITATNFDNDADIETIELLPTALPLVSNGAKVTASAYKTESDIFAHCSLVMDGKIHESGNFAFYLLIDGTRHATRWYEASQSARFPAPEISGEITVMAFYQDPNGEKISCQCTAKDFKRPEC